MFLDRLPRRAGFHLLFTACLLISSLSPSHGLVVTRYPPNNQTSPGRERINLNAGWRFKRWESNPDGLTYDIRPDQANLTLQALKPWILPSANDFIVNVNSRHPPPASEPPGADVPYLQPEFDDSTWDTVNLPHDWAIAGPFYTDPDAPVVGGSMGRLPVQGVGWYRRNISWTQEEAATGRVAYLDIDGAMSYAMVWVNGALVGGWPYPYNSFRLDLTPHLQPGEDNSLAIRLDNPNESARWYPGGGIYRNVWLTKVEPVHVGQYGTFVTTSGVSADSATVGLSTRIANTGPTGQTIELETSIHLFDSAANQAGAEVGRFPRSSVNLGPDSDGIINGSITVTEPRLWTPGPAAEPNLYVAASRVYRNGTLVDTYETQFGIRSLEFDADQGLLVNGQRVGIQGVNQHHDLGAIGAAFNTRAAERRLELLQEMGVNAIRMSHNPPAPELLELTDRMGFLVLDEIFDCWQMNKTANDFHLIFDDWHEADLRNMARRDRNHPSVMSWSYGNEVGEQATGEAGAALSASLRDILAEEDSTRPSSASQNQATPNLPWSQVVDIFYLNYQGAGIRDTVAYSNLAGIRMDPAYPEYHGNFTSRAILSSESSSALSSRGTFLYPVTSYTSAPLNDTSGGDPTDLTCSAYELYTAGFGSSPDKVFASQDANPYVAGEFVWTGLDYLGEPTPYYAARSSYSGILDLAGFRKDRFYAYQARWNPGVRAAHMLPHWTWPDRVGLATPVHVFSAADAAELFLNGRSLGTRVRGQGEYRFRWDEVVYQPGELSVVTHKDGEPWANSTVRTAGSPAGVQLTVDRAEIAADGLDLAFLTAAVVDERGDVVPGASDLITFSLEGPGEIIATDNGDPADFTSFPSLERNAYSGLAAAILRGRPGKNGSITVGAAADGLRAGTIVVNSK